jgi:hypothetical protein
VEIRFRFSNLPEMPRQSKSESLDHAISASTQHELYALIAASTAGRLAGITTLSLCITLDAPTALGTEKQKLLAALRALPSVRSLSLPKPADGAGTPAHRLLYDAVLRHLALIYPTLDALAFNASDHALSFLRGLRALRTLHFSGCARSSPMEALAALGQLRRLESLEVTAAAFAGGPAVDEGRWREYPERPRPRRFLTREVLRGLGRGGGRLRALTVREDEEPAALLLPNGGGGGGGGGAGARVAAAAAGAAARRRPAVVDAAMMRAVAAAFRVRGLDVVWPSGGALPADVVAAMPMALEELRLEGVGAGGLAVLAGRKREGVLARLRRVGVRAPGSISEVCPPLFWS